MGPSALGARRLERHQGGLPMVEQGKTFVSEKQMAKNASVKFQAHTLLLMQLHGLSKPEAQALAYVEGILLLEDKLKALKKAP
ncbi:hypothetical protein [Tortoise microvirus 76]|nr:hypothetical protein [Tortoise microvirus 76]